MSSTLHDELAGLADEAPRALPSTGLWARGRRRQRNRRLLAAAAITVVVALAGGISTTIGSYDERPGPADTPFDELHLPRTVYTPSPWADGTDQLGPPGPLAVVSGAQRRFRDGLTGSRSYLSYFGVSAVDGSVTFLDLPTGDRPGHVNQALEVALSPNGHKIGYLRFGDEDPATGSRVLLGWAVYDTVTGETLHLNDPKAPEPADGEALELTFTGDSRHLVTNYSRTRPSTNKTDELVLWDVETGARIQVEAPGKYWQPNIGSGPHGLVWSRNHSVYTFDPATRETSSIELDHDVVQAVFAPDGKALAWVASTGKGPGMSVPWQLRVGPSPRSTSRVDLGREFRNIVGWRDAGHVVVSDFAEQLSIVEVATGRRVEKESVTWPGQVFPAPTYARDLWANDLVDGERPPHVLDPRWWTAAWGVVALITAMAAFRIWRRRVRA